MKIALTKSLPTRHVRILLTHACLSFPSTTNPQKSFFNYRKCNTHAAPVIITNSGFAHREVPSHKTETKMGEKEAIEVQSNFRSEFLKVLRSRRPPQGITIKLY